MTKNSEKPIQAQSELWIKRERSIDTKGTILTITTEMTIIIIILAVNGITKTIITRIITDSTGITTVTTHSEDQYQTTSVFPVEGQITGGGTVPSVETAPPATTAQTTRTKENKLSAFDLSLDNKFEYQSNCKSPSVKGSLKEHYNFWAEIGSNQYILDVIQNGYRLPLITTPESCHLKNNRSALDNGEFVKEAINELLISGSIIETKEKPYVINPLTVAKNKKKSRLVLDLRHVNLHLWKEKIKFEDWKTALDYYDKGCYMYDFDLKSGYHHVDINKDHQKYLGFCWKYGSEEKYFTFTVLPFGLATAGHIFTKLLRCLVKHWREQSIRIIMYLDDGFGLEQDFQTAKEHSIIVKNDLQKAGLVENQEKSHWLPQIETIWLGIGINSQDSILFVPETKVDIILGLLNNLLSSKSTTARKLASIIGKINSTYIVLGSITRMMLKNCHKAIVTRFTWDSYFKLEPETIEELIFWRDNFENLNVRNLSEIQEVSKIVYSDASAVGAGGYVVDVEGAKVFKQWKTGEESKSSTWRELKGVHTCLHYFKAILQDNVVRWFTDNQAVVSIVQNGSMKEDLHTLALDIYKFCIRNCISLKVDWVPREENKIADELSRSLDTDDWGTSNAIFKYMNQTWGPYTIDLFADEDHNHVDRFYSRHWLPKSEGVDAFAFSWRNENAWIVPPVRLVPQILKKLVFEKAKGTLVVPRWPSSVFWPLLVNEMGEYRWFVRKHLCFKECSNILTAGKNCKLFSKEFKGHMLFLSINANTE